MHDPDTFKDPETFRPERWFEPGLRHEPTFDLLFGNDGVRIHLLDECDVLRCPG